MNSFPVWIADQLAGDLQTDDDIRWQLQFHNSWLERSDRRVLAHAFEGKRTVESLGLPLWFVHTLPERDGGLRALLSKNLHLDADDDERFLLRLGGDLPGAVRVGAGPTEAPEIRATGLRFALAGVQLKFSVQRGVRGPALPVAGADGDWIAKVGSPVFPRLLEIEAATMQWARQAGLEVAESLLLHDATIDGVSPDLIHGRRLLLVRRFDRGPGASRVHVEDFCQLLNRSDKYQGHFDEIAAFLHAMGGAAALAAWVDRMVFVLLSANGDAHLKNWAMLYPDPGRAPRLSPAYDQVSTVHFDLEEKHLQLFLGGERRFEAIGRDHFEVVSRRLGVAPTWMTEQVSRATRRTLAAWSEGAEVFGFSTKERRRIANHLRSLRLPREV